MHGKPKVVHDLWNCTGRACTTKRLYTASSTIKLEGESPLTLTGAFSDLMPSESLREYVQEPNCLHPEHCRFCKFEPTETSGTDNIATHEEKCNPVETNDVTYREKIIASTLASWPQRITPEVHRTILASMRSTLEVVLDCFNS